MTASARPEYGVLAHEFVTLAGDFGHRIEPELCLDIARLAAAMECIDRHVDDVACDASRTALWTSIFALLARGEVDLGLPLATRASRDELHGAVQRVRDLAVRRGVLPRMLRIVKKEIATSEALRHTRDARVYVRAVVREGRLTAALALVVAGRACGPAFRRFFFRLGGPANVVDKLNDASADHSRGEIRVDPGLGLRARLAVAIALALPALFAAHPRKARIVDLGVRYLRRR